MVCTKRNLCGAQFGRLTVVEQAEDYVINNGKRFARWRCKCSCGNPDLIDVLQGNLISGHTTSCGCIQQESRLTSRKHRYDKNTYKIDKQNGVVQIFDKKQQSFLIDLDDLPIVQQYTWFVNRQGYVQSGSAQKETGHVMLHTLLTGWPLVDHINRNPSDNRRVNLRRATHSQNAQNKKRRCDNTSGVIGVSKHHSQWQATINIDKKQIRLGSFSTVQDAIIARLKAEQKYYGEYAPQRDLIEAYKNLLT